MPPHTVIKYAKNSRTAARLFAHLRRSQSYAERYVGRYSGSESALFSAFPLSQWPALRVEKSCSLRQRDCTGLAPVSLLSSLPGSTDSPIIQLLFYSIFLVNSTAFANKINLYRDIIFGYIPECSWEISSPKPGICGRDYLCNDTKIRQRSCKLIFSWYNSSWQNVYTAAVPFRINARHYKNQISKTVPQHEYS